MEEIIKKLPSISDTPEGFEYLFELYRELNRDGIKVTFDFSQCDSLMHNAVALIGGLVRLINARSGKVFFRWDTLSHPVTQWFHRSGFLKAFNIEGAGAEDQVEIPYNEHQDQSKEAIMDYLLNEWLGRGWVNVSKLLRGEIAGNTFEIYQNAVEHSGSLVGIFSCGHYYDYMNTLKLTLVDFGCGIPSNVREYFKKEFGYDEKTLSGAACLEWAFQRLTTTKRKGHCRGVGLDILKAFIRENKGYLEVYSNDGYAIIDENNERYLNKKLFFQGTLVNISLKRDERYYCLASEVIDKPLF